MLRDSLRSEATRQRYWARSMEVNRGRTRADHLFRLKVEHGRGEALTDLVERLPASPSLD